MAIISPLRILGDGMSRNKGRIITTLVAATLLLAVLSSCGKTSGKEIEEVVHTDFTFAQEGVYSFDVDDEGNVYYSILTETGEFNVYKNKDGVEEKEAICATTLVVVDKNSKILNKYIFDEVGTLGNITYDETGIYYTVLFGSSIKLMRYELGMESAAQVYDFADFTEVKKIEKLDGKLYILGVNPLIRRDIAARDGYIYNGETIVTYDIATKAVKPFFDTLPIAMSATPGGALVIDAYDESKGYFFTSFSPNDDSFSEKNYHKNDLSFYGFTMCSEEDYIFSGQQRMEYPCVSVGNFKSNGVREILNGLDVGLHRVFSGRNLYISDYKTNYKIKRFNIDEYLRFGEFAKLNIISAEYVNDSPLSCGFEITRTELGYDKFALTVLSQSPDYDFCIANSRQNFAASLRDKGAFYPLNNIVGVEEYINSCHPFIKEAAVNSNGDIWMLPVSVKVPMLAYNQNLIDLSKGITFVDFVGKINKLCADGAVYSAQAEYFCENALSQYLQTGKKFDTPEFRELATVMKNDMFDNYSAFEYSDKLAAITGVPGGDYSKITLAPVANYTDYFRYENVAGTKLSPMPSVDTNVKNLADCVFLSLNPASENLESALTYIGELVKSQAESPDSFLLKDGGIFNKSPIYSEAAEFYKDATVRFSVSDDIFMDDFYSYIEGKLTLDEFVTEADRKLSFQHNE